MSDIRFNQWLHQSGTGGVSQVASGAVGVGTTNPLADFYVRGDAQITGILTAGHIAMGSSITFGDGDRAYFGDGTDLQIYHSGSHSFIQDTGTGNLFIDSNSVQIRNAAASKTTAKFNENSSVELYFNNTERIRTTNTGAFVTGILTATSFSGDGSNLTGITQTTINNNANNRIITGSGTANTLEGEANLTFDGAELDLNNSGGSARLHLVSGNSADSSIYFGRQNDGATGGIRYEHTNDSLKFIGYNNADKMIIDSSGNVLVGTTDTSLYNNGDSASEGIVLRGGDVIDIARKGDLQLTLNRQTNDGPHIAFYRSGGVKSFISTRSNAFCIDVGGTTERLRIQSDGKVGINDSSPSEMLDVGGAVQASQGFKTAGHPIATYASFTDISGGTYATRLGSTGTSTLRSTQIYGGGGHIATFDGVNKRLGINLTVPTAKLHVSAAYNETGTIITGGAVGYNDALQVNTANGWRRFTVAGDGTIYGPGAGRKNWFDNGSFDCIGGRRANTSMDYGNHHAYGWVTDRFQSRNSVQWTRSTNVPAGKGFSYSTQTNGAGGRLVQAVELPDYGDMGVFEPGSYWCVSLWSTAGVNQSGQAFSYDLGTTKTDIPIVHPSSGGVYQSTGETASGTSTGTFTRYYMVFQMPNSIISTATSAYWTWAFTAAGYATGWQLERVPTATSKPTPYEHVHPSVTIARCRRYCYQNVNSRLMNGYKRHDSNIHWAVQFPVPPTHMPSGSNQSVSPYGIYLHDGGLLSNFQSVLQNPGVNSLSISEFDYRSGRFLIVGSTSYSPTHTTVPAWESQEYEILHGHF